MIYLLTLYDVLLLTENTEYCSNGNEVDLSCPKGYMIDVLWAVYKGSGYRRRKRCGDPNAGEKVGTIHVEQKQHNDKYDITHNTGTIHVEQKQHYNKYDTAQNIGTIPAEQKQHYDKYDIAHNIGTIPVEQK